MVRLVSRKSALLSALLLFSACNASVMAADPSSLFGTNSSLNLSSTQHTVVAPGVLMAPVTIRNGNSHEVVQAGTTLTPAQALAVAQILSTGRQSIVLGALGNAIAGQAIIAPRQSVDSLTIPSGVTVIKDFGKDANFSLVGNLLNGGKLYALSTNPLQTAGFITANNIINQTTGLISSILPPAGLQGFPNAVTSLDLSLTAKNAVTNLGVIQSSGLLNLTASNSLSNRGTLTGTSGVNLQTNTVMNSGTISAAHGNITASTFNNSNLVMDGSGAWSAPHGIINVVGSKDISLSGGTFVSRDLNVSGSCGTVTIDVNNITGTLNLSGLASHTRVATGDLHLGNLTLSGDPTFYNDSGDVTIGGAITTGESLTIIASKNISSSGDFAITANDGSKGCDITMIAGANISASGSTSSVAGPGTGTSSTWTGTGTPASGSVTIAGASATGGDIDFSNHNMTISSAAVSGDNAGGNVRLIAYADSTTGSSGGHVLLSSGTSIVTGGSGTGANGNVNIVAGAASGAAVTTGSIKTTGGSGGGGSVNIINAAPTFTTGTSMTFATDGSISSGNDFQTTGTARGGSITIGNQVNASGAVTITSGSGDIAASNGVLGTIPVGSQPFGVGLNTSGTYAYVANRNDNTVSVIDTSTNTVIATVPVGSLPQGVAITPDGGYVYVTNQNSNNVSVIRTSDNTVVATVAVGSAPFGVALSPDGATAYVANRNDNTVSVIRTSDNTIIATVSVGTLPDGVAVSPNGALIYVANSSSDNVSIIRASDNTVIKSVNTNVQPWGVAFNPTGTFAYVTNITGNTVTVIRTSDSAIVADVPVGMNPEGIALNPSGTLAYIANYGSNNVSILRTSDNTVVGTIPVGSNPLSPGNFIGAANGNIVAYVSNQNDNNVSIISMPAVNAPSVTISSQTGSVNVATATASLAVNSGGTSSAVITQLGDVTVNSSSAGQLLNIGSTGKITTTGVLTAPTVSLQSGATGNAITLGANISAATSAQVWAIGSINQTAGSILTQHLSLMSHIGSVGQFGQLINTNAWMLSISTGPGTASAYINDTASGNVQLECATAGDTGRFALFADNSAVDASIWTAPGVTISAGSVELYSANGNIAIPLVTIGNPSTVSFTPISTKTADLAAYAPNGDVSINNSGDVALDMVFAPGVGFAGPGAKNGFSLQASGNITSFQGTIQSSQLILTANGSIGTSARPIGTTATSITIDTGGGNNTSSAVIRVTTASDVTMLGTNRVGNQGALDISVTPPVLSTARPALLLDAAATISGGTIILKSTEGAISLHGVINSLNAVSINALGPVTSDSAIAVSSLSVTAAGDIGTSQHSLVSGSPNTYTSLHLDGATIFLGSDTLSLATFQSGDGGSLSIRGTTISHPGAQLNLIANGTGSGGGGSIVLNFTGSATVQATGLSAVSGPTGNNAGYIDVSTGGNLIVKGGISAQALGPNANGPHLVFEAGTAGKGNLLISGNLSVDGVGSGNGGTISLTSRSTSPFLIGSRSAVNGVTGILSVSGGAGGQPGSISAANYSGSIYLLQPMTNVTNLSLQAGGFGANGSVIVASKVNILGTLGLSAGGTGVVRSTYSLVAGAIGLSSGTGAIGPLTIQSDALALTTAGRAIVSHPALTPLAVTDLFGGSNFVISGGNINVSTFSPRTVRSIYLRSLKGSIDLSTPLSTTGSATLIALNDITVSQLLAGTGIVETATGAGSTINAGSSTTVANGSRVIIQANGVGSTILVPGTAGGMAYTLLSALQGDVSVSGSAGSSNGLLYIRSKHQLDVSGYVVSKSILLTNLGTAATDWLSIGRAEAMDGNLTILAYGGTLTINSGDIDAMSSISSRPATIRLRNTDTLHGSIVINDGAWIHTSGPNGGNIYVCVGSIPTAPKVGVVPSGVNYSPAPTSTGPYFFGASGITVNNPSQVSLSVIGNRRIVFSTGLAGPGAITLNGSTAGIRIVADPSTVTTPVAQQQRELTEVVVFTGEDD